MYITLLLIVSYCFILDLVNASSISTNVNNILVLNDTNSKKWKEYIMIVLGCMDLDYVTWVEQPLVLTIESTTDQRANYERLQRLNRMSLVIMKHSISDTIRGVIAE